MVDLAALAAPFPPELISWRVGSTNGDKTRGLALAYIDARDVQDRLNEVCGLDWQVRHPWAVNGKLACEIGIRINGEWIWRGDGAGDTDVEAEKGAFSDSFKRAAVRWGIGRYLYDIDSPWVALEQKGRSQVIAESEYPKLRALLGGKKAPAASPAPQKPAEARRDKFEVLDPNGKRLSAHEKPEDWCDAARIILANYPEQAAEIWAVNSPTGAVIREHYPDLPKWKFGPGSYHPVAVLARMVKDATKPLELVP